MILYLLYRLGVLLATVMPLGISYYFASVCADIAYHLSPRDRQAIHDNLAIVLDGRVENARFEAMAKEVFRNFAKYLVDFFRFSKVDQAYVKKYVHVKGLENVDQALSKGKGCIMLSAHIGNWELGGTILPFLGYPMSAVVLTHQNKLINDFFTRQRLIGKFTPIEIGISLKACYTVLKSNNLLALLGDRDFTKNGIYIDFFGHPALMPRGPAALSYRTGSAILPTFMIREPDDTFTLSIGAPIYPHTTKDGHRGNVSHDEEERVVKELAGQYLPAVEACIRKYPTQWYAFRSIWNPEKHENLRPDTII